MDAERLTKIELLEDDYDKLVTIQGTLEEEFTRSEIITIMTELLFKVFNKDEEKAIKYLKSEQKKLG